MTDHYGNHQPLDPYRGYQQGSFPIDPDRTQVVGYQVPAWATPPRPASSGRSNGRVIAAVVGVLAIAGVATAITLSSRGPARASTLGLAGPSSSASASASASASFSSTVASPSSTVASPLSSGTDRSSEAGTSSDAETEEPAPCPADVCAPETDPPVTEVPVAEVPVTEVPVTEAPNNGGMQGPGPIAGQADNIISAAMAWMDARNAGDSNRVLQLGCQDDVEAITAGQPNPAVLSGSSTIRPTGNITPFGTHGLAAYVESSQVDLHDGHTGTSKLPIIWENNNWHICYYPGSRSQAIASLG